MLVLALGVTLALALGGTAGCSGGGSVTAPPGPAWEKFRHEINNSGQGSGSVVRNPGGTPTPVVILWSTSLDGAPISASAAIGQDRTIYVGSEGGTLAALNSDGTIHWMMTSCSICPAAAPTPTPSATSTTATTTGNLGALISSPATYTNGTHTSVFVGSTNGSLFAFEFDGTNSPTCTVCFQPVDPPASASFVSSPTFMVNTATANVGGIFVGATVTDGGSGVFGKVYAVNADGSLKWEFPRPGDTAIGPITSSPAFGVGNTLFVTTDDGVLYALTLDGALKWKAELASTTDGPLAPSPLVNASTVITSAANGVILALNPDGTFHWRVDALSTSPDDGFANSLAVGNPAETPTPTPTIGTPPPQVSGTATPTLTPVPFTALMAVVAVRRSGSITLFDANTGKPLPISATLPEIAGPVESSPALSADGIVVVGDHDGKLHAMNTVTGKELTEANWPVELIPVITPTPNETPLPAPTPQPIRSSPSVGDDGTVYVGSDDGRLYAVGTK